MIGCINCVCHLQVISTKPPVVPVLCQPSPRHPCLLRGRRPSPNATQRTPLVQAISSAPPRFLWRTTAASPWASSYLSLLLPLPCQHTYHPPLPASIYTPITSTISTPTPTHCPNPYQCCLTHQVRPMSLLSGLLLSRCISWSREPCPVPARLSHTQTGYSGRTRCFSKPLQSTKVIVGAHFLSASNPSNCEFLDRSFWKILCKKSLSIKTKPQ